MSKVEEKKDQTRAELATILKISQPEADRVYQLIEQMFEIKWALNRGMPEEAIDAKITYELQ
jgi:hypothetical protein